MKKRLTFILAKFGNFLLTLYQKRFLIFEMAKRDVMTSLAGSMLGFFWTFINPSINIAVLWFVFGVLFRSPAVGGAPYIVYMTAGMAVWNTFSEIINNSTNVFVGNAHLVKKVMFPLSILPVVKVAASLVTHGVFLLLLIMLILTHKMPVSLFWFQALYYFFAMCVLALGIGWITSSVNVFSRDTVQVVNVALQLGFWATPIVWDPKALPHKVMFLLRFNPMFYVVQGYRASFFSSEPFWAHWKMMLYFWGEAFVIFALGAFFYTKLKPHFADVL